MIVQKYDEVKAMNVQMDGVEGVSIRWLLGQESQAPNFYLRRFEIAPGGHTPFHNHPWEHEIYVLNGKGRLNTVGKSFPMEKDTFALVQPGEDHQFENIGDTVFSFLCLIPTSGK